MLLSAPAARGGRRAGGMDLAAACTVTATLKKVLSRRASHPEHPCVSQSELTGVDKEEEKRRNAFFSEIKRACAWRRNSLYCSLITFVGIKNV